MPAISDHATSPTRRRRVAALAVAVGALAVSSSALLAPAHAADQPTASGVVTIGGKPVDGGTIYDCFDAGGNGGCGSTDVGSDGTYTLSDGTGTYSDISYVDDAISPPGYYYTGGTASTDEAKAKDVTVGSSSVTGVDIPIPGATAPTPPAPPAATTAVKAHRSGRTLHFVVKPDCGQERLVQKKVGHAWKTKHTYAGHPAACHGTTRFTYAAGAGTWRLKVKADSYATGASNAKVVVPRKHAR